MGVLNRPAMIAAAIGAAGAIAGGVTIPSQAATSALTRKRRPWQPWAGLTDASVLSAAISDGGSAYASAMVSNNYPVWYKTDNYYAGPGTSIRASIEVQVAVGAEPDCSKAVTLANSSAQPADDGTSVYYPQHHQPRTSSAGTKHVSRT